MEVDLKKFQESLARAEVVFLSTSKNNKVTVRSISLVNIENRIYFYTAKKSLKTQQIEANPNVAINFERYQMEGTAKILGDPFLEENKEVLHKLQEKYPGALGAEDQFSKKENLLVEVHLNELREWVYEGNKPVGLAKTRFLADKK